MALIGSSILAGSAANQGAAYTIDQSLRFEDGSSAYLSRTPASAGNRKTWTWSGWVKRGNLGSLQFPFIAGTAGNELTQFYFNDDDTFRIEDVDATLSYQFNFVTSALFRDVSAWYHIVVAIDTTQSTSTNRVKIYVNGGQVTSFSAASYPSQDVVTECNNTVPHEISGRSFNSNYYFDGYLAEVHFIDGQALDPSYFGETDEDYGHWKPIAYTGSYGTNGFYLDFSNSGSIGEDQAGSNDWTANNLAATDVVLDSPTNNFATWNPLSEQNGGYLKEGNLLAETASSSANPAIIGSTFGVSSGKWYWEVSPVYISSNRMAICVGDADSNNLGITSSTGAYHYNQNGTKDQGNGTNWYGGGDVSYGSSYAAGDVIGVALDMDAGTVTFYKNNVSQGVAYTGLSGNKTPAIWHYTEDSASKAVLNVGQDSSFAGNKTAQNNTDANGYGDFYYPVPSGFLSLCSANLSEPAVVPAEHFNTVLYAGNSSTQSITGAGFQPDLTWLKSRSFGYNHYLYDSIRGATKALQSNSTNAEETRSGLTSFTADGFNLGSALGDNDGSYTYVSWNWKANNTSGSSNTDGSITSTVAANVDAGFSIVSYTGTGTAGATVGHGLSQALDLLIVKDRSSTPDWHVKHSSMSSGYNIILNKTDAQFSASSNGKLADLTSSSTFGFVAGSSTTDNVNKSGDNFIAYCFHSVDGYSKFGSYTGNGSTDGPFVYTGFRPAFVLWKKATGVGADWNIFDATRDSYNVSNKTLYPNLSNAEVTSFGKVDLLSSGFKIRVTNTDTNVSGETYIYMAFAETDFKFSNAR